MQSRTLNRAKLFLSFDSLKGYKEMVKKKERIIVKRPELSEVIMSLTGRYIRLRLEN